jgi:hypothetical protein
MGKMNIKRRPIFFAIVNVNGMPTFDWSYAAQGPKAIVKEVLNRNARKDILKVCKCLEPFNFSEIQTYPKKEIDKIIEDITREDPKQAWNEYNEYWT